MALYYFSKLGTVATVMMKSFVFESDSCTHAKCVGGGEAAHVSQQTELWRGMSQFTGDAMRFLACVLFGGSRNL